jgi:hypothetical protein
MRIQHELELVVKHPCFLVPSENIVTSIIIGSGVIIVLLICMHISLLEQFSTKKVLLEHSTSYGTSSFHYQRLKFRNLPQSMFTMYSLLSGSRSVKNIPI